MAAIGNTSESLVLAILTWTQKELEDCMDKGHFLDQLQTQYGLNGSTPLHIATNRGTKETRQQIRSLRIINLLVKRGAYCKPDMNGNTPLICAAKLDKDILVAKFLELKCDPLTANNDGMTIFHYAASRGLIRLMTKIGTKFLQKHCVKKILTKSTGNGVFSYYSKAFNRRMTVHKWTPLHFAVTECDLKCVKWILKNGGIPTREMIDIMTTNKIFLKFNMTNTSLKILELLSTKFNVTKSKLAHHNNRILVKNKAEHKGIQCEMSDIFLFPTQNIKYKKQPLGSEQERDIGTCSTTFVQTEPQCQVTVSHSLSENSKTIEEPSALSLQSQVTNYESSEPVQTFPQITVQEFLENIKETWICLGRDNQQDVINILRKCHEKQSESIEDDDVSNEMVICIASEMLPQDFLVFGYGLGFKHPQLCQIREDNPNNCKNQLITLLALWKERTPYIEQVDKLKKALVDIGRIDIVYDILQKMQTSIKNDSLVEIQENIETEETAVKVTKDNENKYIDGDNSAEDNKSENTLKKDNDHFTVGSNLSEESGSDNDTYFESSSDESDDNIPSDGVRLIIDDFLNEKCMTLEVFLTRINVGFFVELEKALDIPVVMQPKFTFHASPNNEYVNQEIEEHIEPEYIKEGAFDELHQLDTYSRRLLEIDEQRRHNDNETLSRTCTRRHTTSSSSDLESIPEEIEGISKPQIYSHEQFDDKSDESIEEDIDQNDSDESEGEEIMRWTILTKNRLFTTDQNASTLTLRSESLVKK